MSSSKRFRFGIKPSSILTWGATLLIVLATVAVIIYAAKREVATPEAPEKKLANVEIINLKPQEFIESLTLPAIVEADRVAEVRPEFSGTLERWYFPEGAEVQIGDIIAEIDTRSLRLNLEEMEAALRSASKNVTLSRIRRDGARVSMANAEKNRRIQEVALESAQSNLELARKQFERTRTMAEKKIATVSQLDDARNALTQAELSVTQASQSLNSAELNVRAAEIAVKEAEAGIELSEARISELEASIDVLQFKIDNGKLKAPFSGRLEKHLVQAGEMASPSAPIARIYDLKYLRAVVNVPDRYVAFLDPDNRGADAFIRMKLPGAVQRIEAWLIIPGLPRLASDMVEAGTELKATIARIAQSSNPESNTFEVELRLRNPGEALKHGLIARSRIEYLVYPKAMIIPLKAIQVTDAGPRVLILKAENGEKRVQSRDIEPVSIHGSEVFVSSGLRPGEQLVIAGWKGLVGGEQVNVLVEDGQFIKPASQ